MKVSAGETPADRLKMGNIEDEYQYQQTSAELVKQMADILNKLKLSTDISSNYKNESFGW